MGEEKYYSLDCMQRTVTLSMKPQVLSEIDAVINWEPIEKIVQENYSVGQSDYGIKIYQPLILLKAILIQKWFGIKSDPDLENQINDRFSFKSFIGLPFSEPSPGHSIICRFREHTGKDTLEKVHNELQNQFNMLGLSIEPGMSVDPRVVKSVWMPPNENTEVIWPTLSHQKIRSVKDYTIKRHDIDILTRLRTTWLSRFYSKYLKQFAVVSWIIRWIWRHGYPLYANFLASCLFKRETKQWRPLINLREYVRKKNIPIYKLTDEAFVATPEPKVIPSCDQEYLAKPHDSYKFPEIFVATISNGITYGGTNLVLSDGEVVHHDLYDFERDYTSEELHGYTVIDPKSQRIRWLVHDKEPEQLPAAATFVDACAPNYAHWLTEVLPRVAIFCNDERFKNIPILVNEGLHKNIMESLFLVVGPEREIIILPIGKAVCCNQLYVTAVAGYVPFERRTKKLSGISHGLFSPRAFEMLHKNLRAVEELSAEEDWPEKIYVRRNSVYRKISNNNDLEKVLFANGYAIVEPEKFSFSQQVKLFRNAKIIVSPTGAAMANILFARRNAKIYIFISKFPDASYWYWQNIACASGKTVNYVLGTINAGDYRGIHADFTVDLETLRTLIADAEE